MKRYFNGKPFPIYSLDTDQTVKARLASSLSTLPRYLHIEDANEKQNASAVDFLDVIKTHDGRFSLLKKKVDEKLPNLDPVEDVLYVWLSYTKKFENGDTRDLLLLALKGEIDGLGLPDETDPSRFYDSDGRKETKKRLDAEITTNKKQSDANLASFKEFDNVPDGIPHTPFELEKINFRVILKVKPEVSLLDMFNDVKLNLRTPFATISPFYKVFREVTPLPDWKLSSPDFIIFKTAEKVGLDVNEYNDAVLSFNKDGKLQIDGDGMSISTNSIKDISRDAFVEQFLRVFKTKQEVESIHDDQLKGVFYFPEHEIDKFVMADLIMLDPLFSSVLSIDEHEQASTTKTNVYVHYKYGEVSANITKKYMVRNEPGMKGKDPKMFPLGKAYIRIKVSRSASIESINDFANVLSKLFVIYNQKYEGIVKEYRKYIKTFATEDEREEVVERKVLKDMVPDLFLPTYTKRCANPPEIVTDEEAEAAEANGREVMIFPKDNAQGVQHKYVCTSDDFRYPGVRLNPLKNNDVYPMIPCCYKESQTNVPLYRQYFYDEEIEKKTTQRKIIVSNKLVGSTNMGLLPKSIYPVFSLSELGNATIKVVRQGVHKSKSSFLNCILLALGKVENNQESQTLRILNKTRAKLATDVNAALCKQENYDSTIDEIKKMIGSPDVYLNPRLFIRLLEEEYNLSIYIFTTKPSKTGKYKITDDGLILPRHKQAYYKNFTSPRRSVFIFEHLGSESDNSEYPQCELIALRDTVRNENTSVFDHESDESKTVRRLYDQLQLFYVPSGKVTNIKLFSPETKVISQQIDSYGKARGFVVEFKDENGAVKHATIFTTPVQPLRVVENELIIPVEAKVAMDLLAKLGVKGSSQTVAHGKLIELSGVLGNVNITIPIIGVHKKIPLILEKIGVGYPLSNDSKLADFSRNKKMAQCISENMLHTFSKFLNGKRENSYDEKIDEFFAKNTQVDASFSYKDVQPSKFFKDLSGLTKKSKLMLSSDVMEKRLKYILKLAMVRDEAKVLAYKDRTSIANYYTSASDFDHDPEQVILEGGDSMIEWLVAGERIAISNSPLVQAKPYFFRNTLVEDRIFLAQNTDTIEKACDIAYSWASKDYGYNRGKQAVDAKRGPFTLISFTSVSNIKRYKFGGGGLMIMGCKVGGRPLFTALMRI